MARAPPQQVLSQNHIFSQIPQVSCNVKCVTLTPRSLKTTQYSLRELCGLVNNYGAREFSWQAIHSNNNQTYVFSIIPQKRRIKRRLCSADSSSMKSPKPENLWLATLSPLLLANSLNEPLLSTLSHLDPLPGLLPLSGAPPHLHPG